MKILLVSITLFLLFSCKNNDYEKSLDKLVSLEVVLTVPKPGEWRAEHHEERQSFERYINSNPVTISDEQNLIYIQPIGDFTNQEKEIVDNTVEYVHLFFGLKTVLLEKISEQTIPEDKKRINYGIEQLDAGYINTKILPKRIPSNGIVIMGITAKDLYPEPSWNYVFGLANYKKRTGISSFNRFIEKGNYKLCLDRTIKTAVHEISHMFSMNHCKRVVCLMNGVNDIVESDSKPNALCSECLKKLSWNLKFNNVKRFQLLINYLKKHHLDEDAIILQKQLNIIKK